MNTPTHLPTPRRFYFAGKTELRTSYANQRGLAERDLGGETQCIHGNTLAAGCRVCRASGEALVLV